jgi:hypothetical protein
MFSRAWQNRKEWDGKLVMAGIPLVLAGTMFQPQFVGKWPYLMGLSGVGGCMLVRGLTLNSRKYRKEVDLFNSLRNQSIRNPSLTAAAVLQSISSNPEYLKLLKKRIGSHRTEYFMDLMRQAEEAQNSRKIPLASFLAASPLEKMR